MKRKKAFQICHRAMGICLNLSLILFLIAPSFGTVGWLYTSPVLLLLGILVLLDVSLRLGANPRRIWPFLLDKISGCPLLVLLLTGYLGCSLLNLSYSPVKGRMLENWPIAVGGVLLCLGILFYVDSTDKLDNLFMDIFGAGMVLGIVSLAGVHAPEVGKLTRMILIGLLAGGIFFLSAQYNKIFKTAITLGLCGFAVPAIWRVSGWSVLVSPTQVILADGKQNLIASSFGVLQDYRTPEVLLGRGSGYDITLSGMQGVGNFLLADLLNGGVLRFALALSLWLCIFYFVGMLFMTQKGIPFLYLAAFGVIFVQAFFSSQTGFLFDPLFMIFCALLVAEHTMLQKGKRRWEG